MQIAICICTFKRRDLLSKLLQGVSEQTFSKVSVPEITIVVVDNDSARSAEDICLAAPQRWPIKYVVEPRRNMASIRNRAVLEAGNPEFVALLDDDEVPTPQWLDELLSTRVAIPGRRRFWTGDPGLFLRRATLDYLRRIF